VTFSIGNADINGRLSCSGTFNEETEEIEYTNIRLGITELNHYPNPNFVIDTCAIEKKVFS
jgi:hypothetical protein